MSSNFGALAPLWAVALGRLSAAVLIPALLTAALATPAHGSQVSYRDQELSELLSHLQSSAAAVVTLTLATPASERKNWPVPGEGSKACAPYQGWQYRGRIEAVHFASPSAPALAVGAQLLVSPATMPDLIYLEQLACTKGISKSPIWERFAGIEPKPGQKVLAVLAWQADYGWLERVSGAWLDPADLPKVLALLPPAKRFLPRDALLAEWSRQPPDQSASETLPADRPRLLQTLARIGAPGAAPLLPPELAAPTEELWLTKAAQAREPLQRLTALVFLNRLKSRRAWEALAGLTAQDAAQWPAEADLTWALQRAGELTAPPAELQPFLQRWQQRPRDESRQVALNWRRFVTQQSQVLPPLVHTRAALLAISEQWGRANAEQRAAIARICAEPKRLPADQRACEMRWTGPLGDLASGAALQVFRHSAAGLAGEAIAEAIAACQAPQGPEPLRQKPWPALLRLTELAAMEQLPLLNQPLPPSSVPGDVLVKVREL